MIAGKRRYLSHPDAGRSGFPCAIAHLEPVDGKHISVVEQPEQVCAILGDVIASKVDR
ncbi:hypothetical protein PUV47_02750 [Pseudovibrio exalbescens]|uniref:hypothetical protein n=1 Tax=Pseudovibrio exalbescens TaxID=197461 RepID=UPI002366A4ED|nr:hypothetical protein [Pseudovibrio exalbescens]MDD7908824.1 hypothetical protein [Pseudovibrio exalbescens]